MPLTSRRPRSASACVLTCLLALVSAGLLPARTALADDPPNTLLRKYEDIDFRRVIDESKSKVFPAVVYIRCVSENFDSGKRVVVESSGSGVIISPKGEVVTNWHVVDKAIQVRCLLQDGQALKAAIVGTDKDTDVALLQLELPANSPPLPFATLGDSKHLIEGQFVMAMGAPWGLSRSVSLGILSCTRRFLPAVSEYSLWLQTDAAISPGNSGGPLVDTNGSVIGINTRGTNSGGDMGFAIPAETVRAVVGQLRDYKKVNWSWTGLQIQPIKDFNRDMYFDGTEGVIVADTEPDSPARTAGVLPRDRIMKVNGVATNGLMEEDIPDIRRLLGLLPKGAPAKIELTREGKPLTLELIPREKGVVEGEQLDCPRWDLTLKAINQFADPDLYFHRKVGVYVNAVRYPGNASQSGLQAQDIIIKLGKTDVTTLDEARAIHKAAIEGVDKNHRMLVTVLRNGLMKQVVLDFSRDFSKE